jgi:hypothetical protein
MVELGKESPLAVSYFFCYLSPYKSFFYLPT